MNLIFFGGIHGSGKNYLLDKIAAKINLEILTASDVLKWKEYSDNPESKFVKSILDTQDRLIINLSKIILPNIKYLLNGHFCLLNKNGNIERIPEETFIKMSPKSLYLKIADPSIILERLKCRDNKSWSLDLIKNMQIEENKYAQDLSKSLNIPLYIIKDNQEKVFFDLIKKDIEKW
ncbi:MAG: ATP-binding protein [Alphaproteobacteria bacterium]|nr:ATP-binding protein [Alphaproteobacteria bacterium]